VSNHVPEKHPSFAEGREHGRDVEVRADEKLRWGLLCTNIREQEQRQEPTMATVHIDPPLAVYIVAAVNVPPGVSRIPQTGEAHGNGSSHALSLNPAALTE
jgi:hypothetical protein